MTLIFLFSSQVNDDSQHLSRGLSRAITGWIVADFDNFPAAEQDIHVENINLAVRKTAHFFIYMVLGSLLLFGVSSFPLSVRLQWFIVLALGVVCAAADEYNQTFRSGRTGQPKDVLIDVCGLLTGCMLYYLFRFIIKYVKKPEVEQ